MAIPILSYHAIDEQRSPISVTPDAFRRQMQALSESRCNVITLGRLVNALRGDGELPDRSVAITFDDGFESTYKHAFPVLQSHGFAATVFAVAGYCGKLNDWPSQPAGIPRMQLMDWPQIAEMERHGIEFGAHTYTHPRLDQTPASDLEREIVHSKHVMEDKLGHAVDLFAYPYGRFNTISADMVGATYAGACTTRLGTVTEASDPLALERVEILYVQHPRVMRHLSGRAFSWYLDIRRPIRSLASAVLRREWE
ncbi:MAG: polysaccharide deacetylase family protein [Chloroflexi bacterium]|nr:polysaccharide deacetylase family protein [Chloroflexota bacterium]